ncbi:hypothetical protein [Flagellimonas sp.]|uniref:hypothetical protein n=1 Tax=Flagellimonas sp. TaxID=2058762 RepID=UPI003C7E6A9B
MKKKAKKARQLYAILGTAAVALIIWMLWKKGVGFLTGGSSNKGGTGSEAGKGGTGSEAGKGGSTGGSTGSNSETVIVDNSEVVDSLDAIREVLINKGSENCGCS